MTNKSPSVAIAACDGLLESACRTEVVEHLITLANIEESGNFAAVAALNVLDVNANPNAAEKAAIAKLPRKVAKPPARMGG